MGSVEASDANNLNGLDEPECNLSTYSSFVRVDIVDGIVPVNWLLFMIRNLFKFVNNHD